MGAGQDLYNDLAVILIECGPPNSRNLKFNFEVLAEPGSVEAGGWSCDFDYVDSEGNETWFGIGSADAADKLCELALELRIFMSKQAEPVWNSMTFEVDLVSKTFNVKFSYD